ncbi:MAG: 16S rRNA (cytosine(1402)-N(4))-methyltransferase RsmH [Hydrogenothermaceae bacterium]|nr:16S rRNA (cytosine(1402)-N(4))-methyltransferase RsmH [Hydrogenothermaceae bacterium]
MIEHYPVLYREIINFTKDIEGWLVDATLGGAGHSYLILESNPNIKIIGIDRDDYAIEIASQRLSKFKDRVIIKKSAFKDIDKVLQEVGLEKVNGFLFDLGVSTFQLKMDRGFSFQREEFLDMRMDKSQYLTAYDVVNTFKEYELFKIIKEYGEERFARCIAKKIVENRKKKKIETTKELADIVIQCYPPSLRRSSKIHPATKTFQAIRIVVNDELNQIETALSKAVNLLEKNGLIMVISFHSLEDRIVKNCFKRFKELKLLEILTKKPITPSEEELRENPPSRSGKLRVARRV